MHVQGRIIAVLTGLAALLFAAEPASAAPDTRTVVWLQVANNVNVRAYDIDYAMAYLNARTGRTRIVRGRCVNGPVRCIDVRFGTLPNRNWYAMGEPPTGARVGYVRLSAKSKLLNSSARRRLFLHELGHTRNLAHTNTCASVMHHWIYCNGKLVPYAFTARERVLLRSR